MKQKINWEDITLEEAQDIADALTSVFSVTAKCYGSEEVKDVSYLTVVTYYDDCFHSPTHPLCKILNPNLVKTSEGTSELSIIRHSALLK